MSFMKTKNTSSSTVSKEQEILERDFWEALRDGNLIEVKECITKGVDKNIKDAFGWTALHRASEKGHLEIVKYLIETCRVDPKAKENNGWTALHLASYNGHLEIVKYLIEACQVGPAARDNNGWTALHGASENGHLKIIKYLIETCQVDIDAKTKEGKTSKDLALEFKRSNVMEYLTQVQVDTAAAIEKRHDLTTEKCIELRNAAALSCELQISLENTSCTPANERNIDLADIQLENQKMNKKIEYIINLLDSKSKNYCNSEMTLAEYKTYKEDETTMDTVMKYLDDEGTTSCQMSNHDEGFIIIEEHFEMLADDGWQEINFSKEERI